MSDELYELRNNLLLGSFHQVVAEGQSVKTSSKKPDEVQQFNADRDLLIAKAQVGLGQYDAVLADLRVATKPSLICVRNLASFHKELAAGRTEAADAVVRDSILPSLGDVPSAALAENAIIACGVLIVKRDFAAALKISATWAAALDVSHNARLIVELRALSVDALLRLNRPDLAEKELAVMKSVDDESIHTLLSGVMVALRQSASSPDRLREATNTIQEIIGRCCVTVSLLNLQALCLMGQGKFADAEKCLIDALAKRSGDADTIANLAVVSAQMGKPTEVTQRFISQTKHSSGALSPWAKSYEAIEQRYQDACKTVGTS